jgi:hypothetical protein
MIFFWRTVLDKKARAKRPRCFTTLMMRAPKIIVIGDDLWVLELEKGIMKNGSGTEAD